MGEHGRRLGAVVGKGEEAAGHVETARGKREGVHDRRIEHGDAVGLVGPLADRRQPAGDLGQDARGLGRPVFAAEGGDQARMLAVGGALEPGDARRLRRQGAEGAEAARLVSGAAGQGHGHANGQAHGKRDGRAAAPDRRDG